MSAEVPGAFLSIARFDRVHNLLMLGDHLRHGLDPSRAIKECQGQP